MHSSFGFDSPPLVSSNSPASLYIQDITKYIPIGCLRITRSECFSSDWETAGQWQAFAHPVDISNPNGGPKLLDALQNALFGIPTLRQYVAIHKAGWIRMEFRANDQLRGQIRVYVLADDVGRSVIDRSITSLRRAIILLLGQLDISATTWSGEWNDQTDFCHVDPSLDATIKEDPSLFHLFNTLPSPKPDPEFVTDLHAKDAMHRILDNDINGLKTMMHQYQCRSAALMLQWESKPAQNLDPRLRHLKDQRGKSWYCDADAGSCFREPRTYEAARGGICAETMGLGKTLICLGLIMATKDLTSQIPAEYLSDTVPVRIKTGSLLDMAAATIGRRALPWKTELASLESQEGYAFERCREALRKGAGCYMLPAPLPRRQSRNPNIAPPRKILLTSGTIVVAPANLLQQWQHEIKKHTTGLKVLVMKSMADTLPEARAIAEYDIILFSKQRFDKEAVDEVDDIPTQQPVVSHGLNSVGGVHEISQGRQGSSARRTVFPKKPYHSPLKDLHFKRLIVDEGHTFGNSSSSSRTEATAVIDFLQLTSRWIVSGTPTKGLYGAEVAINSSRNSSAEGTPTPTDNPEKAHLEGLSSALARQEPEISSQTSRKELNLYYKQERKDFEKLGNIATSYLKARPWQNRPEENDYASWAQLVMQPRHGSKSRGNVECLRATLEGMIIRHRPEDVLLEVSLPPINQKVVFLDGSVQNKMSLNTFSMMIITNAVTSERKDADYFFHSRQRKSLQELVSNLRQASFFWAGFETENIQNTIGNAKKFLEEKKVPVTPEDEVLLHEAIKLGEHVLANDISQKISKFHEMPMYVQNDLPEDIRVAWSLDGKSTNPTLMSATMVHSAQKFVESQLWKEDPAEGLLDAGKQAMKVATEALEPQLPRPVKRKVPRETKPKKPAEVAPTLAGGVTVGDESSPRRRSRVSSTSVRKGSRSSNSDLLLDIDSIKDTPDEEDGAGIRKQLDAQLETPPKPKSSLKKSKDISGTLDPTSSLASTSIVSTASAKLSYLMDSIMTHQLAEKILIFYEADNTAYYIAQALECLGIKHLIYAKTLSSARRSQYVVTFNQSEVFRVLLMDVSQAAFGLDLSSASRVYFVNPVFSPQVEAQAVKRAHRIGQTKPVFVETLILKGSIEEVILERRKDMSTEEHNSCKSILDDRTMYDWIRNVRFVDLGEEVDGPAQMARLEEPRLTFGKGAGLKIGDPDADLILGDSPQAKGKGKKNVGVSFRNEEAERQGSMGKTKVGVSFGGGEEGGVLGKRKAGVSFADEEVAAGGSTKSESISFGGVDVEGNGEGSSSSVKKLRFA